MKDYMGADHDEGVALNRCEALENDRYHLRGELTRLRVDNERMRKILIWLAKGDDCWCGEGCHQMPPGSRHDMCEQIRNILTRK